MGLIDRVSRLVRANLNAAVSSAEDPEKVLDQAIMDMQEDLVQMRQAVASAIASQKRVQQQRDRAESESAKWQQRAQLALQGGKEDMAREALVRKKTNTETAASLSAQLEQQSASVAALKRNLIGLESKISEAKTKKDMLKARASAAKANEQLQRTVGNLSTSSAMGAFERMEEKIQLMEAKSEAAAELAGADLESQFAQLEAGGDVDYELEAMKAQMLSGAAPSQGQLPAADQPATDPPSRPQDAEVDKELEALKSELDQL
ncbi:PspA/IM30 family protein [Romeria aff. gracilis LEGE 07310]|uniref:PspA/IM30 family protein n=1 Tax=Vasconcelosia minhoensis LEGE 07310 TaxID=915328 RepID=A0A8J7AML1_9CYAN|nr:PspA/IM30 family protein [Romeria gracilis]MBE9077730.1 PspA/IM30 family protein [Romeria aff. gracilis LEGE 07310]